MARIRGDRPSNRRASPVCYSQAIMFIMDEVKTAGGAIVNENQVVTTPGDAVVTPETDIEVEEEEGQFGEG